MANLNFSAKETKAQRCFSDVSGLAFTTEEYGRTRGHKLMVDFGKAMSRFVKELDRGIINPVSYELLRNLPALLEKQRSWMEHETEEDLKRFDKMAKFALARGAEVLERWEHSTREKILIVELGYEFYDRLERNSSGLGELSASIDRFGEAVEKILDERHINSEHLNRLTSVAEIVLDNAERAGWASKEESAVLRNKLLTLEVDVLLLTVESEANHAG